MMVDSKVEFGIDHCNILCDNTLETYRYPLGYEQLQKWY